MAKETYFRRKNPAGFLEIQQFRKNPAVSISQFLSPAMTLYVVHLVADFVFLCLVFPLGTWVLSHSGFASSGYCQGFELWMRCWWGGGSEHGGKARGDLNYPYYLQRRLVSKISLFCLKYNFKSHAPRRTDSFSKISLGKLSLKIRDYLTITCLLPLVFGDIGFRWKISFIFWIFRWGLGA